MGATESNEFGTEKYKAEENVSEVRRPLCSSVCFVVAIPRVLCILALVTQFCLLDFMLIVNNSLIWLLYVAVDLVILIFFVFIIFITYEYKHITNMRATSLRQRIDILGQTMRLKSPMDSNVGCCTPWHSCRKWWSSTRVDSTRWTQRAFQQGLTVS